MSASALTSMDKSIRTRLLSLQSSFFQSLQNGTDEVLTAFYKEMMAFNETLGHCVQDLSEETYLLIYSFVQTSNAVIPALIDLDAASEKINQEQSHEFSKLLGELSLDDDATPEPETYPTYIQPAHAWLLNNLHNPYPSKEMRTRFSKQTNTPHKDIDSWFTDVRKRIGWNSLRKKHFSTRKDMIAAATRFFKPSSPQLDHRSGPDETTHFDEEFTLLEDSAKNLYSRRFSASTLANELAAMKDVTPEANPAGQGNLAQQMSNQEIETIPNSPYTSPEFVSPSSLTFSSPSPPPSSSQPSSQSRKRRQSDSDSNSGIETRPCKRTRNNVSVDPRGHSPLPSTQSDAKQHSPSLLDSSFSALPVDSTPISEGSRKRKRRSSDSDSEDDQGRMKRAHCTPSFLSNSSLEPLPSGSSNFVDLDQWIKSLGGEGIELGHSIPEPVYETCSQTAADEIHFHRYASSSPSSSVSSLGPSTPPDYNSSDSPAASHQSLPWPEPPLLTKVQGYDGSADITSELLSTNWSEEGFLFDLDSPGNADFPSQNWDLGLIPAISANDYSISQIRQEVVDKSIQPWTNEEPAVPISFPGLSNQLSPLTSFSDNSDDTPLPQVFQHPSKGAKIRYLQTLINEVQNVRLELAL